MHLSARQTENRRAKGEKKTRGKENKTGGQATEEGRKVAFYGRTYKFLFQVREGESQWRERDGFIDRLRSSPLSRYDRLMFQRTKKSPAEFNRPKDRTAGAIQAKPPVFFYPIEENWSLIGIARAIDVFQFSLKVC